MKQFLKFLVLHSSPKIKIQKNIYSLNYAMIWKSLEVKGLISNVKESRSTPF